MEEIPMTVAIESTEKMKEIRIAQYIIIIPYKIQFKTKYCATNNTFIKLY